MRSSFVPSQFLIRKFSDLGIGSIIYSHLSQLYAILLPKFYPYICLVILLVILHQKEWQKLLQSSLYRGTCQVPRAVRILMLYSRLRRSGHPWSAEADKGDITWSDRLWVSGIRWKLTQPAHASVRTLALPQLLQDYPPHNLVIYLLTLLNIWYTTECLIHYW